MKPGIYLEITPAGSSGSAPGYGLDIQHSYLIYRKADGTSEVIRGGPGLRVGMPDIDVETGKSLEHSKDRYKPGDDTRPSRRLGIPEEKLDESWSKMRSKAEEIGKSGIKYWGDNDPSNTDQTSNSVTRAVLGSINYPVENALPEGTDPAMLPGIKNNLEEKLRLRREEIKKEQADHEEAGGLSGAIGGWPGEEPKTGKPDQKTTPQEQDRGGLGKEAAANQKALDAQKEEDRVPAVGVESP